MQQASLIGHDGGTEGGFGISVALDGDRALVVRPFYDGSPAVDAGTCTDIDGDPVATDQRGAPRPFGETCDMGAFEFGATPPTIAGRTGQTEAAAATASASSELPAVYTLAAPYPNPFRQRATLRYGQPEAAAVRLAVYDVLGREVAVLADGEREAGWRRGSTGHVSRAGRTSCGWRRGSGGWCSG